MFSLLAWCFPASCSLQWSHSSVHPTRPISTKFQHFWQLKAKKTLMLLEKRSKRNHFIFFFYTKLFLLKWKRKSCGVYLLQGRVFSEETKMTHFKWIYCFITVLYFHELNKFFIVHNQNAFLFLQVTEYEEDSVV